MTKANNRSLESKGQNIKKKPLGLIKKHPEKEKILN